ncbi:MAG: hypothetical protein ACHREM_27710, partial [Polyangiales bacterium]
LSAREQQAQGQQGQQGQYDAQGFDAQGFDRQGYDQNGLDAQGYDRQGNYQGGPQGYQQQGYAQQPQDPAYLAQANVVLDQGQGDVVQDDGGDGGDGSDDGDGGSDFAGQASAAELASSSTRVFGPYSQAAVTTFMGLARGQGMTVAGQGPLWLINANQYGIVFHVAQDDAGYVHISVSDKAIYVPYSKIWEKVAPLMPAPDLVASASVVGRGGRGGGHHMHVPHGTPHFRGSDLADFIGYGNGDVVVVILDEAAEALAYGSGPDGNEEVVWVPADMVEVQEGEMISAVGQDDGSSAGLPSGSDPMGADPGFGSDGGGGGGGGSLGSTIGQLASTAVSVASQVASQQGGGAVQPGMIHGHAIHQVHPDGPGTRDFHVKGARTTLTGTWKSGFFTPSASQSTPDATAFAALYAFAQGLSVKYNPTQHQASVTHAQAALARQALPPPPSTSSGSDQTMQDVKLGAQIGESVISAFASSGYFDQPRYANIEEQYAGDGQ